ncbi:hypothetical protein L5515_009155 [Caenorhabditis briggsae]|uniref:Protein kinase domain-containing protein n=1 Tax=Caenorhabditis briggsae TaxID=6238 RepID=A0AAE9F924_CAEBR|nr:hypothetical protein L5515_009155 [Caenorhabditis briggsae]
MSNSDESRDPSLLFASGEEYEEPPTNEIDVENLTILDELEKELFHVVHRGELRKDGKSLAVTLKGPANVTDETQQKMIFDEIPVLIDLKKNPNILGFVGVAEKVPGQFSIVSEYAEKGCLLIFLRDTLRQGKFQNQLVEDEDDGFVHVNNEPSSYSNNSNNETPSLRHGVMMSSLDYQNTPTTTIRIHPDAIFISDLVAFGWQIASGMKHLANLSYVHRQLALRSIYIANDKTIRIGGLGLARKNEKHYYRIIHKEMPLPFHWMAPETLANHKFDEKSDVWGFAVCLWEIFSLGGIPYQDVGDILQFLKIGRRISKPDCCPQQIYQFMLRCWNWEPEKRPSFDECEQYFKKYLLENAPQVFQKVTDHLEAVVESHKKLDEWVR